MLIILIIVIALVIIAAVVFTKPLWDRPKDSVDMLSKFNEVLKLGYSQGPDSRILELRENFVKVGSKSVTGEKAVMVKQRPEQEFRVIFIYKYVPEFEDLKIEHIYKDEADQLEIVKQFETEIAASLVKRNK